MVYSDVVGNIAVAVADEEVDEMTVVLESLTARNFDSFCAPLVAVVAVAVPPYQFADTFVHHYHYHYPF